MSTLNLDRRLRKRIYTLVALLSHFFTNALVAADVELRPQEGHFSEIESVAFSPDGRFAATGGADGSTCLWEVSTGLEVRRMAGHAGKVVSLAFSPTGRYLASGSWDGSAILWDTATGRKTLYLTANPGRIFAVAFSPDGRLLLTGSGDGTAHEWNAETGREVMDFGQPHDYRGFDLITAVAYSPDGLFVLTGADDNTATLWDAKTGKRLREFGLSNRSQGSWVMYVGFSKKGHMALVSSKDEFGIRLWDVASGTNLGELKTGAIESASLSRDERFLATANTEVSIWDIAVKRKIRSLALAKPIYAAAVALAPDGKSLLSTNSYQDFARLWDVQTGAEIRHFSGGISSVNSVTFSPNGQYALTGGGDSRLRLWDLTGNREMRVFDGHTGPIRSLAFSSDGSIVVSGSTDRTARIWDVETGQQVCLLQGHTSTVFSVAFSSDGRLVATGGGDATARLWSIRTCSQILKINNNEDVTSVAFSPDGKSFITGGFNGGVILREVSTGQEVAKFKFKAKDWQTVSSVVFSRDGRLVLTTSYNDRAVLVSAENGDLVRRFDHQSYSLVNSVTFSHDNRLVLAGGDDKIARIYSTDTGQELFQFEGHSDPITSVAFSPDDRYVLTGSDDGTKIWNVDTKVLLCTLIGFRDGSWAEVLPDGRFDISDFGSDRSLSWVVGDEPLRPLPLEIFTREYYTPSLLLKFLDHEKTNQVRSVASLNRVQPLIQITKVKEGGIGFVNVTVDVASIASDVQRDESGHLLRSGVYDVRLFRNDQMVGQEPELEIGTAEKTGPIVTEEDREVWRKAHHVCLDASGRSTITFHHVRVPLRVGVDKVQFTAYAFNSDRVKSLTTPPFEYFLPKASGSTTHLVRRAYLISMGVNANQAHWNLDFAVASAQDAARLLHAKLASEYKVVEVSLLSALAPNSPQEVLKQATKANLKAVLDLLAGRPIDDALRAAVDPEHRIQPATPDDAVVLFIASHGYADPQGTLYLVPYDTGVSFGVTEDSLTHCQAHSEDRSARCQRGDAFLKRTISNQDFTAWWAGVDAGEMVMILDSCHSAAVPGREFRAGPLGDISFGQLAYDKGIRILSATQSSNKARATLVQGLGHSLLVEALMRDAEDRPEGSIAEWLHDAIRQVRILSHQLYPELSDEDMQVPKVFDVNDSGTGHRDQNAMRQ